MIEDLLLMWDVILTYVANILLYFDTCTLKFAAIFPASILSIIFSSRCFCNCDQFVGVRRRAQLANHDFFCLVLSADENTISHQLMNYPLTSVFGQIDSALKLRMMEVSERTKTTPHTNSQVCSRRYALNVAARRHRTRTSFATLRRRRSSAQTRPQSRCQNRRSARSTRSQQRFRSRKSVCDFESSLQASALSIYRPTSTTAASVQAIARYKNATKLGANR